MRVLCTDSESGFPPGILDRDSTGLNLRPEKIPGRAPVAYRHVKAF
jgi:hypothetical protein